MRTAVGFGSSLNSEQTFLMDFFAEFCQNMESHKTCRPFQKLSIRFYEQKN